MVGGGRRVKIRVYVFFNAKSQKLLLSFKGMKNSFLKNRSSSFRGVW